MRKTQPRAFSALILICTLLSPTLAPAAPAAGLEGAAATAHPLATAAAIEMLRQGGNAADAAAAAGFVLAVAEPYSSGVGGGGFALVHHQGKIKYLDFRETAPQKATRDMYVKDGVPDPIASRDGVLSAGVPGAVAGYLELSRRFGKLPRRKVLAPAIRVARQGFPVTPTYQKYAKWRFDVLNADPEARRIFLIKDAQGQAQVPPVGHRIVQKDLAKTLSLISKHGAKAFYRGAIARKIVADTRRRGGLMTMDDLRDYKVRDRKPLVGTYRGHTVVTAPPPSSGGQIMLTILNIMETLAPATQWRDVHWLHTYIEASKHAFADRYLNGDPDYVSHVDKMIPHLISKERAAVLASRIGERARQSDKVLPASQTPFEQPMAPAEKKERNDTSHLCVVDKDGNAVSMTTTINYGFGAGYVAKGTGIVMNDEMDDFAVAPGVPNAYGIVGSEANAVEAGKVPLSSMTPTMVFEGAPDEHGPLRLVVGSPGGSRIPTTVVQAIMHHIDHGADVERAISIGRVHHQHLPDRVRIEAYALEPATRAALESKGHVLEEQQTWSNASAIAIDPKTGVRTAAADPRGLGQALVQ